MPGPFYFAWVGAPLEAQVTLVTNGTTHGARPKVVIPLVADTVGQQLQNIASTVALETGELYFLTGPGIAPNTYFVFDDSILSGLPDSLNLSSAPSGTFINTQFVATKTVPAGTVLGTLTHGSNAVVLSPVIAAGTYGVFGTGIGETDIPIAHTSGTTFTTGGGLLIVGSCYMVANGAGGGTLEILAATPYTHFGLDEFGQQTAITTYTVAAQPVRATASGQFPLTLMALPTGDPYTVTGIPAGALDGLSPKLVYNISGTTLQVGSTFIAPTGPGATSIELDLFATSSEVNAILTITGPRTPNAPWDPATMKRFDEEVLSVDITHEEGAFATLTITLKNPGVGLLTTGRNLWCWLAWDRGWLPDGSGTEDLVLLFNGRIIGVPQLQAGEIVQLQFLARPDDLNAQKLNLANSLAVLPYYDPVWLASPASADTVLETYSALFHIDRTTLAVTVSDILEGEDGTLAIGESQAIYDKFALSYGQPPLVAVAVSGTVTWQQQAEGSLDVTQSILDAFRAQGSAYRWTFALGHFGEGGGGLIETLCGDGLKNDWPKPGTNIGGGWSLSTRNDGSGRPLCYIEEATRNNTGGWLDSTYYVVTFANAQPLEPQGGTFDQTTLNQFMNPIGQWNVAFPMNAYKIRMVLNYRADRKRTETVSAVLTAAIQSELSDSSETDRDSVSMTSEYISQAVDPNGALPIGNVAYRSYFQTARGADSFHYLLLAARAKMRARARSVDVTIGTDWRTALGVTLRMNVQYSDRRLPGGTALGKVKSIRATAGRAGMQGEIMMGCAIGTGVTSAPQPGMPVYVDDGYVNDYQIFAGQQLPVAGLSDFAAESLDDFAVLDDGLDLANPLSVAEAVNECVVSNGLTVQIPTLAQFQRQVLPVAIGAGDPINTMRTMSTTVTLDLKPVAGAEYHTDFYPALTQLGLPKMIDLGA